MRSGSHNPEAYCLCETESLVEQKNKIVVMHHACEWSRPEGCQIDSNWKLTKHPHGFKCKKSQIHKINKINKSVSNVLGCTRPFGKVTMQAPCLIECWVTHVSTKVCHRTITHHLRILLSPPSLYAYACIWRIHFQLFSLLVAKSIRNSCKLHWIQGRCSRLTDQPANIGRHNKHAIDPSCAHSWGLFFD